MSNLRVLLVGEGINDKNLLEELLPRLTKHQLSISWCPYHTLFAATAGAAAQTTPLHVLTRKVQLAVTKAQAQGVDALVFVHDVDSGAAATPTPNPRRAHADVVTAMRQGLPGVAFKVAFGAPCRMIEAWMLADRATLAALAPTTQVDSLQWHANSTTPRSQDMLKTAVDIVLGRARKPADYVGFGKKADVAELCRRSKLSFAAFAGEVASL